jgi:hypothetical protein
MNSFNAAADPECTVAATACGDDIWALRDGAWRNLVVSHLLPTVSASVHLVASSYNSAYSQFVDGLTNNEHALQNTEVVVSAEGVEAAFVAAAAGTTSETEPAVVTVGVAPRASTIADGLIALIGRRVEVSFLGAVNGLVGQMVAVHPDALVVAASETTAVVSLGAVAYVSIWQLTDNEDRALLD